MKLLLASGSATRRQMLDSAGVAFTVASPRLDEDAAKAQLLALGKAAASIARGLAEQKALSVTADADTLVLGSDQVLEQADGSILSKPLSRDDAAAQLRGLAGTTHRLHAAASLVHASRIVWSDHETVSLAMRHFSDGFLNDYLELEWSHVRWNVGAYRIEGAGVQLFDQIEGSHFAVLGMPLLPLLAELRRRGSMTS